MTRLRAVGLCMEVTICMSHSEVPKETTVLLSTTKKKKQIVSFSSLYSMKGLILWKPEQKLSWPSETLIFSGQEMSLPDWPICCNFVGCVKTCDKVVTGDWSVMACFIMVYLRSSLFWGSVFKDWISREFCWSQEIP